METYKIIEEAEKIAGDTDEALNYDPVATFRGDMQRRRLSILASHASLFTGLLRISIGKVEKDYLLCPMDDERNTLESLNYIQRAMKRRKPLNIIEYNGMPPDMDTVVLSGDQVAQIHDILMNFPYGIFERDSNNRIPLLMNNFSDSLIRKFPFSDVVTEEQGKLKGLFRNRQK